MGRLYTLTYKSKNKEDGSHGGSGPVNTLVYLCMLCTPGLAPLLLIASVVELHTIHKHYISVV